MTGKGRALSRLQAAGFYNDFKVKNPSEERREGWADLALLPSLKGLWHLDATRDNLGPQPLELQRTGIPSEDTSTVS